MDDVAANFCAVDDLTGFQAVAKILEGDALFVGVGLEGIVSRDIRYEAHADESIVKGIFCGNAVFCSDEFIRAYLLKGRTEVHIDRMSSQ